MKISRIFKWVTGGLEAILAIPLIGGSIIVGMFYTPLLLMLALHITTLVLTKKDGSGEPIAGSVLGIVASTVGWIPFVGWILHVLTAIFLMTEAGASDKEQSA